MEERSLIKTYIEALNLKPHFRIIPLTGPARIIMFSPDLTWAAFSDCASSSQSPIDLDSATATAADYSNFTFSMGYKIVQEGTLSWANGGKGSTYSSMAP